MVYSRVDKTGRWGSLSIPNNLYFAMELRNLGLRPSILYLRGAFPGVRRRRLALPSFEICWELSGCYDMASLGIPGVGPFKNDVLTYLHCIAEFSESVTTWKLSLILYNVCIRPRC